jgi:hypothetical protein
MSNYVKEDYTLAKPSLDRGMYCALRKEFSQQQIIAVMKQFGYSDENFAIMSGDLNYLQQYSPDLFNELAFRTRGRTDTRNKLQYYQDLVAGWIYEDIVRAVIEKQDKDLKIELNGADSAREVKVRKVTNDADYKVIYKGKELLLELVMSHTGSAERDGLNFRNNKRSHLVEQGAKVLVIETHALDRYSASNCQALILDKQALCDYRPNFMWNKPTDFISTKYRRFAPISMLSNIIKREILVN